MNNEITFSKKCDIKINMGCIPAKSKSEITLQAPPNCEQLSNIANVKDLKITEGLLIQESKADPHSLYEEVSLLGEGAFGKVFKVRHKISKVTRAMKLIIKDKVEMHKEDEKALINEINVLKSLDHPNIMKVYEYFNTPKCLYIVSELCTGGELYDKITSNKCFNEELSAYVMKQLLSAVDFCHQNGIIHRDLKPENILIESEEEARKEFFTIKVIDFGTSDKFAKGKMIKQQIGTPLYIAPEVLNNNYNEKCDLWSCGVILYILLCGAPPFYGTCEDEIFHKIITCKFSFKHSVWKEISPEAKDLITKLLDLNPKSRLSAKEALEHKWFTMTENKRNLHNTISDESLMTVIKNISEFRAEQKLQQATLAFLVHNLSTQEDLSELKEVFLSFDKNGDGRLTKDELLKGMTRVTTETKIIDSLDELMKTIDTDNNGYIEFEEFIRASIDKEKLLTEKNLKIAFDVFDKDKSGGISASELKLLLGESNVHTKDVVWKNMIKEIDLNGDGQISFEEFKNMMNKVILKNKSDSASMEQNSNKDNDEKSNVNQYQIKNS